MVCFCIHVPHSFVAWSDYFLGPVVWFHLLGLSSPYPNDGDEIHLCWFAVFYFFGFHRCALIVAFIFLPLECVSKLRASDQPLFDVRA